MDLLFSISVGHKGPISAILFGEVCLQRCGRELSLAVQTTINPGLLLPSPETAIDPSLEDLPASPAPNRASANGRAPSVDRPAAVPQDAG